MGPIDALSIRKNGRYDKAIFCLRHDRNLGHTCRSKDPHVALDLLSRTERLPIVIGKLDCRPAIGVVELADQACRIEGVIAARVTVAEIVRQQSAPACAEADAPLRKPLFLVEKIAGIVKIRGRGPIAQGSSKIRMKTEDLVHIERIRRDEELLLRIAAAGCEPCNVFIARNEWIF